MKKEFITRNNIEITNIWFDDDTNQLYCDMSINGEPFEDLHYSLKDFKYQFSFNCDGVHSINALNKFINLIS